MREFDARAEMARRALPENFGDGWMSRAACDTIRIAAFAGFDTDDLIKRVAMTSDPSRTTNARSVERVMAEMDAELAAAQETR